MRGGSRFSMLPLKRREGFQFGRLMMVLSGFSPLFVLLAFKGATAVPDIYLVTFCMVMVLVPAGYLLLRIHTSKRNQDKRELMVGNVEGYGHHILTYILAMLLPFYRQDMATSRDVLAIFFALALVVVIFWHLNLHYINLIFILLGYRTFLVHSPSDANPYSGGEDYILVTRRTRIDSGQHIIAYRVSDTVFIEALEE